MAEIKVRALCETPHSNVFCGPRTFLILRKHVIRENMFPVMEDDSYFLLVRRGRGSMIVNGVRFELMPGSVCWIQCTEVVTIEPALGEPLERWSIVFEYALYNYLSFKVGDNRSRAEIVAGMPVIGPGSETAACMWRLFQDFDDINSRRDYGSALVKVSLLGQLALHFGTEVTRLRSSFSGKKLPLGWWASIYIAMHSQENIDAQSTAQELGTNVLNLNRQLRLVTSLSFDQMLNRNRCILAASYFLCENLPLDFIYTHAGFKSEVSFFRCFKKLMGTTPSKYRDGSLCSGQQNQIYRGMIMDDRLLSVMRYLYNNISEPISLSSMARDTFVSPNIIRSLIDKAFGISYKDILSLFRIRYAESLLSATDLYLMDIAVLVGFNSVSTFSRRFKEINGETPNEYRKKSRERSAENAE